MKLKTGGLLVFIAELGLLGVFGCDDASKTNVGPVTVPPDAAKSSEEAAKQMLKQQGGMYGGAKGGSPPQGGGMGGARPRVAK
ncbi:MAG: hypothetical protein P4L84_00105 [Isosphaeraceae bacterium]|nr:hypothetical protein [Isosphaeraceae bacterium]